MSNKTNQEILKAKTTNTVSTAEREVEINKKQNSTKISGKNILCFASLFL
jgi:hypothetical protein